MLNLFSEENKSLESRSSYILNQINQYEIFGKLYVLNSDFENNIYYRCLDTDFLCKFFEFIYQYSIHYIQQKDRVSESVFELLRLSIPIGPNPPLLFQFLQDEYNRMPENEKIIELNSALDELMPKINYKNIIDAIKVFYFCSLNERICVSDKDFNYIINMNEIVDNMIKTLIDTSNRFHYERLSTREEQIAQSQKSSFFENIEEFLKHNTPKTICEYLDEYIVGQESAKMQISIGVYYYLKRLVNPKIKMPTNNNMLMVGPSGCGKTEIIRTLRNFLPIPVIIYDISSLTASGYRGDNKDNVLRPLIDTDGIALVFLDEFDKICSPSITFNGTNFSYESQGQLLSMIEGNTIPIDDGANYINTENTLFIAGGAYEGMKIEEKKEDTKQIGFTQATNVSKTEPKTDNYRVSITDVIKYGLRPELAGRFSSVITLYPLNDKQLQKIIGNYVSQFEQMIGKKIILNKEDINEEVKTNVLGCRHIKQIINDILRNALFEAPNYPKAKEVKIYKVGNEFQTEFILPQKRVSKKKMVQS